MTRDGVAYELPTSAPRTEGSGSSSSPGLLPTPRATDGTKGGPNQRGTSGDLMLPSAVQLLPTPTAMDSRASGGSGASDVTLTDAMVRGKLLPTPVRGDGAGGRTKTFGKEADTLQGVVTELSGDLTDQPSPDGNEPSDE